MTQDRPPKVPAGLYLIADASALPARGAGEAVAPLLEAGVALVQYRCKHHGDDRRRQAESLQAACRRFNVPLIVNDDIALADALGADGVHLGAGDDSAAAARRRLGNDAVIGVSCYDSAARAARAQSESADYVAFGAVFASPTKPQAARISLRTLREHARCCPLPVCAIGGIRPNNARAVLDCGVDLIAAASGLLAAADPRAAVAAYLAAWPRK